MAAFVSGFVGVSALSAKKGQATSAKAVSKSAASKSVVRMGVFEKAMGDFKSDFPQFAKKGWGVTVKSERWNGRHAMAGWLVIWVTAYMKGHGLLPTGILEPGVWGPLVQLGGYEPIPRERAVVLIANVHLLLVSIAATIAPFSFQDKLLLEEGESDETPAGLIPAFKLGLTKEAELWNGRLAMLGLVVIVFASVSSGKSVLELTNQMFGGVLY